MTVNVFAENFGPAVEAVCLALLAALGVWLCCWGLDHAYRGLKARLDGCAPLTVPLKPGWRYEVRLDHAGSDPAYTGSPKPDYDYTLEFSPKPESVLLDDPQGLFGVHGWDDGPFLARDKAATATVYKVDVAICVPSGDSWTELDASRVVLDDEELRVKMTVTPQMDDLAACRLGWTMRIGVRRAATRQRR